MQDLPSKMIFNFLLDWNINQSSKRYGLSLYILWA